MKKRLLLAVFLVGFALALSGGIGQAQTQQQVAPADPSGLLATSNSLERIDLS